MEFDHDGPSIASVFDYINSHKDFDPVDYERRGASRRVRNPNKPIVDVNRRSEYIPAAYQDPAPRGQMGQKHPPIANMRGYERLSPARDPYVHSFDPMTSKIMDNLGQGMDADRAIVKCFFDVHHRPPRIWEFNVELNKIMHYQYSWDRAEAWDENDRLSVQG